MGYPYGTGMDRDNKHKEWIENNRAGTKEITTCLLNADRKRGNNTIH